MTTLDQLRPGQRGRVVALLGEAALVQRLMELGVVEGEEVAVIRVAPLGDPIEVQFANFNLYLRRAEASGVEVHALADARG